MLQLKKGKCNCKNRTFITKSRTGFVFTTRILCRPLLSPRVRVLYLDFTLGNLSGYWMLRSIVSYILFAICCIEYVLFYV